MPRKECNNRRDDARPREDTDDAQAQVHGDAPLNDQAHDNSQATRGRQSDCRGLREEQGDAARSEPRERGGQRAPGLHPAQHQAHSQQQRYEGQRVTVTGEALNRASLE